MTAKVEIFIKELENIIAIPVNAVFFRGEQAYCTVVKNNKYQIYQ
jgi:hypothetical protein